MLNLLAAISGAVLVAQGTWGIGQLAIAAVVIAAVVALVVVAVKAFGLTIPPWVANVFWICVVAFVVILAIRFVMSM